MEPRSPDPEADGAAIRIDEAVATIQKPVEVLARANKQTRRRLRLMSTILAFDLLLSGALGFVGWQAREAAASSRRALVASCEAGNEFKKLDLQRWNYIIALSLANPTTTQTRAQKTQAAANLAAFRTFLAVADAPRTC